jgi:hypothetical protein
MGEFSVHYNLPFAVLVTFAIAVTFTLVRGVLLFSRPARVANFVDSSIDAQGIAITLFCALYLILEFAEQSANPKPTMPVVPDWMLAMLGLSNALDLGRKFYVSRTN